MVGVKPDLKGYFFYGSVHMINIKMNKLKEILITRGAQPMHLTTEAYMHGLLLKFFVCFILLFY